MSEVVKTLQIEYSRYRVIVTNDWKLGNKTCEFKAGFHLSV